MKRTFLIFLCAIALITGLLHAQAHGNDDEETFTQEQLTDKDILVKIDGMTCLPCVQSVKKVFGKQDSVAGTFVVLEDQTLTLDIKDNQTLSDAKIKELVEWGGYDLVSIERLKS